MKAVRAMKAATAAARRPAILLFLADCIVAAVLAAVPAPAPAQIPSGYVQTTATVTALANGQFAAAWTNLSSSPQLALLGCVSPFQQTVNGSIDGFGHFSVLLADTSQICPSPSTWTFTLTYACPPPAHTAFMVQVAVTGGGGTEDISSQITAALPTNPCTGGGGGGGAPGGANTDVQFNNNGSLGGSSLFTWSGSTVNVGGALPTNHVTIGALDTPTSWTFDTTTGNTALNSITSPSQIYYVSPTSTDFGAAVNTIVSSDCPTYSDGYKHCTIVLPAANSGAWATTVHVGPGVSIVGQGEYTSVFDCTVAGDCLLHDQSASSGEYAHTVNGGTAFFSGFRIVGNGATGQNIFHGKDMTNVTMLDVDFDGASESGGACIDLEDVNYWTERNTFVGVDTGYNCTISWLLYADTGNPYQPHPSFGYNRILDAKLNPTGNQTAFAIENGAYFYNSTLRATVNAATVSTSSPILFYLNGGTSGYGSEYYYNETQVYGEGTLQYALDLTSQYNQFVYSGSIISASGSPNNITSGAVVTHWLDDYAYGTGATNEFYDPVLMNNSLTLQGTLYGPITESGAGTNVFTNTNAGGSVIAALSTGTTGAVINGLGTGIAQTNNNEALFGFTYAGGAGSTANYATVGLYGDADILNVFGTGDVSIGSTTDPGVALGVNGAIKSTSIKTSTYTVSTLPAATSLAAGTQVVVTDATSFTPGTCTGGGSDYMIAVTNGTAWSCH